MKNNYECIQLFIPQMYKIFALGTLYFWLHKNDKCVNLSIYSFKSPNLYPILLSLCSPRYKEFHNQNLYACRLHY
jgi:hypothetical protein